MPTPGIPPPDSLAPPASVPRSPERRRPDIDHATSAYGTAAVLEHAEGRAPLLLVCEHASARIPEQFGTLGLDPADARAHIGWDIGALDLARHLSARLDAPLVHAGMSRLIYDCNRPPDSPTAIRAVSERFVIPGNQGLTAAQRDERVEHCYRPFLALLEASIERTVDRAEDGVAPAIVTIHTFTPVFDGVRREVELGVLHGSDAWLADRILALAERETGLRARRNAPYGPGDGVLHTVEQQAVARGLPGVMLEVRNDLVDTPEGVVDVGDRLARSIAAAIAPGHPHHTDHHG
jgi:predicted N-formylglutamate amidohydrolase